MVRKLLLKRSVTLLLICALWSAFNIAPTVANTGICDILSGQETAPNESDTFSYAYGSGSEIITPSYKQEIKKPNIKEDTTNALTEYLDGPDFIPPPKNYKTLEMILADAELAESASGPPPVSVSGTRKLLVLLADLSDATPDPTHSSAYFNSRFFDTTAPSVRDFYDEVSYGAFTYVPGAVMGWYPSTRTMAQYTSSPYSVFAEAIGDVDPYFNFGPFDVDNNGVVKNEELTLFMIVSGNAGGAAHGWNYANIATTDINGLGNPVSIEGEYSYTNEFRHIGSYCHELGHDLGLPDLYDVNGGSEGIGNYGLMGGGSWTFSHPTAWSKIQLGWIVPKVVTKDGYYTVRDAETHSEAYILMDPARPNEYFLIENRQPTNSYYESIGPPVAPSGTYPDHGIVIYHIDETKIQDWITSGTNNVNNDEAHKGVDVECADYPTSHVANADDLDALVNRGDTSDLWDDTTYDFSDNSSICKAIWYDGTSSGLSVRGFPASSSAMTVFFSGVTKGKIGIITNHGETLYSDSLAEYYRDLGFVVEDITTSLTLTTLQNYQFVIVGELGTAWSASEITATKDYIASGGGFVAIGDQLEASIRTILANYSISYTGS